MNAASDPFSLLNTVDDDGTFVDTESYDVVTEELGQLRREIDVLRLTTVSYLVVLHPSIDVPILQ